MAWSLCGGECDFNPRPPCGGRLVSNVSIDESLLFQSTSSVWRTTIRTNSVGYKGVYFNPRPPCGGRPRCVWCSGICIRISIHVLRVEDDCCQYVHIRAPLQFQSTSSVWRTTVLCGLPICAHLDFNPRPPCGGRQCRAPLCRFPTVFQSTSSVWRTTRRTSRKRPGC